MKKKPVLDLSHIRIARSDSDADLMVKVRQALPRLLREVARQRGELEWAKLERAMRRAGTKGDRGERAKFIREHELEYLRDLGPKDREEAALRIHRELKERRDLLPG